MPLRKVHELSFLWFGLPGPLLFVLKEGSPNRFSEEAPQDLGTTPWACADSRFGQMFSDLQTHNRICTAPFKKGQSWSAANGGLRDRGLSKPEDI